jgi:hypothetical protein
MAMLRHRKQRSGRDRRTQPSSIRRINGLLGTFLVSRVFLYSFSESKMRASLSSVLSAAGLVAAGWASPAPAEDLNSVVLNLDDARRFEEQSRRLGRTDEEHYWHNYGAGLEEQRRGGGSQQHGASRIGPEEARRLKEQADLPPEEWTPGYADIASA